MSVYGTVGLIREMIGARQNREWEQSLTALEEGPTTPEEITVMETSGLKATRTGESSVCR
jgi:hypothetical protein